MTTEQPRVHNGPTPIERLLAKLHPVSMRVSKHCKAKKLSTYYWGKKLKRDRQARKSRAINYAKNK